MKLIIPIVAATALLSACGPRTETTTVSPDGKTITKTVTTAAPGTPLPPATTITQANLDRIYEDMSKAEVETILGQPTSSRSEPIPLVGGTQTTAVYQSGNSAITIVYKNDKMKEKSGTFNP